MRERERSGAPSISSLVGLNVTSRGEVDGRQRACPSVPFCHWAVRFEGSIAARLGLAEEVDPPREAFIRSFARALSLFV